MGLASPSSSFTPGDKERLGRRGVLLGGAGNLILAGLKVTVGLMAGSQALLADGVHSVADLGATLAVFIGIRVARVPPDAEHPYGHEKAEPIAQKLVGIFLILAGAELLVRATASLLTPGTHAIPGLAALWVAIFSLILKEVLYRQNRRVAKNIRSQALMAFAVDHRADVWASLAASVGILGSRMGFSWMDALGGGVVSLFVVKAGWDLVVRAVDDLMDRFGDSAFLLSMTEIAQGVPGVKTVQGIKGRRMGSSVLLDIEISVDGEKTVRAGHDIAHAVHRAISQARDEVASVHVHVNPDPP